MSLQTILVYCTRKNVQLVLSVEGVNLRIDLSNDGVIDDDDNQALDDAIIEATEDVNFRCNGRYTAEELAKSNWVNRQTTILAARAVCRLRGNPIPDSIQERCDEVNELLDLVADSKRKIHGIRERRAGGPVVDNVRCDPRYNYRVNRVEQNSSSKQATSRPVIPDYREAYNFER